MTRETGPHTGRKPRRGLTLTELLLATAVMSIVAGITGMLATTVEQGWKAGEGLSDALQNGRVIRERILQRVQQAYTAELYPGFAVAVTMVGTNRFPDTLVVWSPSGTPVNVNGPPKISECIFFCPNPSAPNELLEITAPSDNRDIPFDSTLSGTAWLSDLSTLKSATTSTRVVVTKLLRVAQTGASDASTRRGCVRFEQTLGPTAADWASYRAGTLAWSSVPFAQSIRGTQFGLRQSRLRFEMQLMADGDTATDTVQQEAIAVFGSAALYYDLPQ